MRTTVVQDRGHRPNIYSDSPERERERINAMHLFSINCPHCNEARARHPVARSEYPPVAPQFVGGVAAALVFE
jgi:hypothetical protein